MVINLYSKENCPKCLQAAMILKAKNITVQVYKLDTDYTFDYLEELCAAANQPAPRSFPMMFNGDDTIYIGTFDDMKLKLAHGLL